MTGGKFAERFHPGEYVREEIAERKWSIRDLAEKSGLGMDVVAGLITETYAVDEEIAYGLARAFGTSWTMWLNLQKFYDEWEE